MKRVLQTRGFTLIELIIAIGLFALVGLSATLILNGILTANESGERHGNQMASLQRIFLMMRRDFEQIIQRPVHDEYGTTLSALIGQETTIEFTRSGWSNPLAAYNKRSEQQRLRYSLEEGALIREHWLALDRAPNAVPERTVLLQNVKRLVVRYYDATSKEWSSSWPPVDQTRSNDLPAVIEMLIDSEGLGEIRRLYGIADGVP